ncbi:MAG: TlpA disulfide reductase family protein, partial [Pseudomonadota bacterium]
MKISAKLLYLFKYGPILIAAAVVSAYIFLHHLDDNQASQGQSVVWTNPDQSAFAAPFTIPILRLRGDVLSKNTRMAYAYNPAAGQLTVLHFWASWCNACTDEAESIGQLAKALRSSPVNILGIATDDTDSEALVSKTTE